MNLMRVITREETIGGLEISDTHVRLAYFTKQTKKEPRRMAVVEEKVPAGAVQDGRVKNPAALKEALTQALGRASGAYCIVSIPPRHVYTKILSFPEHVTGSRLDEAVQLALGFQLPLDRQKSYVDYEFLKDGKRHEVFLAACERAIIDEYLGVLEAAGIKAVAVETHPVSIARAAAQSGQPILVSLPYEDYRAVTIIEKGIVRFVRTLPKDRFSADADLAEEIRKIKDFYATEYGAMPEEKKIEDLSIGEEHKALVVPGPIPLAAIGALLRGQIPGGQDTMVSLLPLGTESAYEYQKAVAFGDFLRNTTIAVALFFVFAYGATAAFVLSLSHKEAARSLSLAAAPVSGNAAQEEKDARELNDLVGVISGVFAQSPLWSGTIDALKSATPEGIAITGISVTKPEDKISLSGFAKTRAGLNAYKKTIQDLRIFTAVELPLTNLDLKENIPFTMSFALAEPSHAYQH